LQFPTTRYKDTETYAYGEKSYWTPIVLMIGAFALKKFCKINMQSIKPKFKFSYKPLPAIIYPISLNCKKYGPYHETRNVFLNSQEAKTIDQLEIPTGIIYQGYGEYVAYRLGTFNNLVHLSRSEFEQVYAIFNKHLDYASIKNEISTIDPNIEIAFIPRSLYELVFIRKMLHRNEKEFISQDLENSFCLDVADCHKAVDNHQAKTHYYKTNAVNLVQIEKLAYKINRTISKRIYSANQGMTYPELNDYLESEIKSVKEHCQKPLTAGYLCPVYNFQQKYPPLNSSLGIYNDIDAKLIKASLKLECSTVAHKAFLLYRGGDYSKDFIEKSGYSHSLSYGTGLFAGSLYDCGATSFHYARKSGSQCYVIVVPFKKEESSPFYIPKDNAIMQLFMEREHFHARSKIWNSEFLECTTGVGMKRLNINYLVTKDSKRQLEGKFISYMKEAVILKE